MIHFPPAVKIDISQLDYCTCFIVISGQERKNLRRKTENVATVHILAEPHDRINSLAMTKKHKSFRNENFLPELKPQMSTKPEYIPWKKPIPE